jgi:hypothetical protein
MADFQEQLKVILALREKCRQCDESVYRARVELNRADTQLQRAQQQRPHEDPQRDQFTAGLRRDMDRLNAEVARLRGHERELAAWFTELAEQQRERDHLQKNLTAVRERIKAQRDHLGNLKETEPAPTNEITKVEGDLERLQSTEANLATALEKLAAGLRELEAEEQRQRRAQEELSAAIAEKRAALRDSLARLSEAQPQQDSSSLQSRKRELTATIDRIKADCGDCEGRLSDAISGIYVDNPHPRDALANLDDATPFLLLPVRIETIFVPSQSPAGEGANELWVRVYPDDIAVHTHEKILTDREVLAGELYWTELVAAAYLTTEKENRRRAAWRNMVELFSGQRGAWVAQQTKPTDYDALVAGAAQTLIELLGSLDPNFFNDLLALDLKGSTRNALEDAIANNDGDAFSRLAESEEWFDRIDAQVRKLITGFPVHDLTKTDGWTRAPRTNVLPDRFVLLLYRTEAESPREITGNLVPDTMFVGPDPLDAEAAFENKDNALTFGKSFDWMSDFDKAVAQGMGFRVRLTPEEAGNGFAKILVLGVFLSADTKASAALLEELVDNHQFGPKGFSLVRQGTPTNNTERDGSGYSDNDAYDDLAFFTAIDPPAFDPDDPDPIRSQTDGRLLADALGIGYPTMQTVQRANQTDVLEAASMNKALFPGTLGYWLRNWMGPAISDQDARDTRSFFTSFVSGRGSLPAVRVGNQPYGVLLTSDFSRWQYPENRDEFRFRFFADQTAFLKDLYRVLSRLEAIWTSIANTLSFVGKPNTDSAEVLMNILGLHPTSVEFYQRIGYSDEYLRNLLSFTTGRYAAELANLLQNMPATARAVLHNLGVEEDLPTVSKIKSLHVLWQHYTTSLKAPNLVENKPPSETNLLTINYIDSLANTSDTQKIIKPDFSASALLYLMLRNALLLQLYHGSYEWLKERTIFDTALAHGLAATTLVAMRETPAVSKLEIIGTHIGAAEPANPTPNVSVANWLWNGPDPTAVEASFLKEQKSALAILAQTPTARLERCLIEHMDCCTYRLDAWQTGLFAQRLQTQRRVAGEGRQTGIYLGAYGWVENVKPSAKTFLSHEGLPAPLRPSDSHPVLEEDDVVVPGSSAPPGSKRGGYVHAPSINHAAAAALLRNAYLSHADPNKAEMFEVNLSSERVRRAEFILEGMRNGQPIEALLGYQFERRLHDRTSESADRGDVPVLELNEFVAPFRQAFPFESVEIVQAGTGPATETVPAYSVVNGLKLMQATLNSANGFGLASILPAAQRPNPNQGAAIVAEQDALRDTLDAVKDLLMAENAYQLVRGNFDRVAAVSLAQKDAHVPPQLEVIETPRGTEFTFTNRVTLHFEDLDPAVPANNPWAGIDMTPRAKAETGINKWLGSVIAHLPGKILCEVTHIEYDADHHEISSDIKRVSLADLRLQPIDFVWLVSATADADNTGGDPDLKTRTGGASELETRIAFQYRRAHAIADDQIVRIKFKPSVAADEITFAEIFPLARHLRGLLMESRALNAEDFLPAAGGKETTTPIDKKNPKGFDAPELRTRVQTALNALAGLADVIDGPAAPSVQMVFTDDPGTTLNLKLGDAFKKLEEKKVAFTDTDKVTITFSAANAGTLHQTLREVASFGVADAFPPESDLAIDAARLTLLARAQLTAKRLRRTDPADGVLDRAMATFTQATTDKSIDAQIALLLAAGNIVLGESFNWLPRFSYYNANEIADADADRNQLLSHATTPDTTETEVVEEWLHGLARVRSRLNRWEVIRTLADALNDVTLALLPIQVPYRINDSWLAVEFPETDPNDPNVPPRRFGISRDTLSIAAHGQTAFQSGVKQSGLLIDDWTEEIPTVKETTGIAFRFNQPNAAPPQALLLTVTPNETGSWDWDDLVGTLNDTLRRAKRRAVEPDQLETKTPGWVTFEPAWQPFSSVWNTFAPALVSEFSTVQLLDVSLDLMTMLDFLPLTDFYSKPAIKT